MLSKYWFYGHFVCFLLNHHALIVFDGFQVFFQILFNEMYFLLDVVIRHSFANYHKIIWILRWNVAFYMLRQNRKEDISWQCINTLNHLIKLTFLTLFPYSLFLSICIFFPHISLLKSFLFSHFPLFHLSLRFSPLDSCLPHS